MTSNTAPVDAKVTDTDERANALFAQVPQWDWVLQRQPVIESDHPLSLGQRLFVFSSCQYAKSHVRIGKRFARKLGNYDRMDQGIHLCFEHPDHRADVILIGDARTKVRLIEIVTHEVSHWVDTLFTRCHVRVVDTEIRAYYLDWAVGKVMWHFKL